MKSQDPDWKAHFMEDNLVRKGEVPRTFATQDAGSCVTVGTRIETSYAIIPKAPDLPTRGQLMNGSCH